VSNKIKQHCQGVAAGSIEQYQATLINPIDIVFIMPQDFGDRPIWQ